MEQNLTERLNFLELRVNALENEILVLKNQPVKSTSSREIPDEDVFTIKLPWEGAGEGLLETNIAEYGMAWLGNIVLFLGIVFLTQFITTKGFPIVSTLIGVAAFAGILLFSRTMRKSFVYLSFMLSIFGFILLFYTIFRLHFYTSPQVIANKFVILALLFGVIAYTFYESVKRKSEGYAFLTLLLTLTLAVFSDMTYVMLTLVAVSSVSAMYLFNRFGWSKVLFFSIILNYLLFFNWLINNPLLGHDFKAVTFHQYCYIYLAFLGAIYSLVVLFKKSDLFADNVVLITVLLNGFGFSFILGLLVLLFFPTNYILIFVSIAVFCVAFSILLKYRSPWKYSPALYALYGFMAISVALYGIFNFPKAYLFLSLQSLLVVSIALWYRSRIIVVMNLFLFITILLGYMAQPVTLIYTNFAFPVVAFFSARIIRLQKERLMIETELMRNTYLVLIFLTMLYAVYKAVPAQYVTLSWTLTAVVYLVLSITLKNVKYRYMMFANIMATAFYLFAVDLAKIDAIFRIIAFLFLAIITIGISIYYVNKIKKRREEEPVDQKEISTN